MATDNKREQFISDVLCFVSPGTPLREGLENVLRAKTGALIVIGNTPAVQTIVDGGFSINCDLTPANLYELAKMDGAIILSEDAKRILYANTQLIPDSSIPSMETGIRHRTAERVARQTGQLVISISQRRNVITLYRGPYRYSLKDIGVILTKANQAIQTLEKYKSVLDQALTNLGALEFEELVTLHEVALVVQRIEMVLRIKSEIIKYINELGTEGRLISMQMEELVSNIEDDAYLLIKDYCRLGDDVDPEDVLMQLHKLSGDELLEPVNILKILGYTPSANLSDEPVFPRGYRILSKIPRLPASIVNNLIEEFSSLPRVMMATIEELDDVEGIGEVRARAIKEGLKRIQEQVFIDRHI
ncbi:MULTISPECIES: DNA integrity scanning diadenylate cyclase DisA [Aneurinibacillus]|uniref:diadenylate cyclase n=1 Tax=Aneurinibacillus thermoaerophilus TaxID=143495 RepID=A0A1G8CU83_ANETH|nr:MULTISPECIES: DNA integrity scanning diadenylate cyclase DisA [Aneurinibacillus]AMA74481.1 DNA integrity scanning protein DisA [Aneurinibacillus sp. XH2]MED0677304.1 DNA integrity scanning diadenylate cyclase DisA [Aneurinibacillus thermoaerophilus]MED0679068.1 DNA integrity scanning diadenylate cyclase DisA [Aneurinibacillus thermoaerophilus]MED0738737.1 DNA integrity scanning diadenylate cyclase DisA [Aneurinibacillus thermoaerophilus]MED0757838.1 DNA integrity scanning diadenylate cyclas